MMRKSRLFVMIALGMALLGASCSRRPVPVVVEPTRSNTVTQAAWFIDPYLSNIAIIVLDYQTLQFKAAYFTRQEPCRSQRQPVSDEELKRRAGGIFDAVGKYWTHRVITDQGTTREELAFQTRFAGDLAILEIEPTDFGGFAVSHRCSGAVIFAGSIIWAGMGKQFYPVNPIASDALIRHMSPITSPQRIDITNGPAAPPADEKSGLAAWNAVQDLNITQELAALPYDVLVYLYPRRVGVFDPNSAEWVIFVQRNPTR